MTTDSTQTQQTTTDTTTTTTQNPWYHGIEGEELGYLQNRGFDKLTPLEAYRAAAKAHREAEKHIGAPADKIVRLPAGPQDAEGWKNFYARIGVPETDQGYNFSGVKFADGTELDAAFTSKMASVLRSAGVAADKAPDILRAIVQLGETEDATDVAAREAALNTQREALKIDWGARTEGNLVIAKNAAKTLGVSQEAVAALEGAVGYAAVMKMFHDIGVRLGEDTFVSNPTGSGNRSAVFTRDQAKAKLSQLETDQAWVTKYLNGDTAAALEFDNLTRIVAGQ